MNDTKEKHATFTPGPWVVKHDRQGHPFIGVESDPWAYPGTVATVEQEKDARLIAAAPDLLAQCKLFEKVLTYYYGTVRNTAISATASDNLDKLREVLAKVEGGEG
jgi:hypothetical protein